MPGFSITEYLRGVAIAGHEFGDKDQFPGGVYFMARPEHVTFWLDKGFNCIRMVVLLERIFDGYSANFRTATKSWQGEQVTDIEWLDEMVELVTSSGAYISIDPHNYGRFRANGQSALIGSSSRPSSVYAAMMGAFAARYKSNPRVILEMMNEPHDETPAEWGSAQQAGITAIRAASFTNPILATGVSWSSAERFVSSGSAAMIETMNDPENNMGLMVHAYLDGNASGKDRTVVGPNIGPQRLTPPRDWARGKGWKVFCNEFMTGDLPDSLVALRNQIQFMEDNDDVFGGWMAWGAGGHWVTNYELRIQPKGDMPGQIAVMEEFLDGAGNGGGGDPGDGNGGDPGDANGNGNGGGDPGDGNGGGDPGDGNGGDTKPEDAFPEEMLVVLPAEVHVRFFPNGEYRIEKTLITDRIVG
jgi:endoglucanase